LNLQSNEVQTITTSANDVDEIQIIQSTATPQGEIQTITVSPPPGETVLDALYSFSLVLDTTNSGGSIQYSGQISATADASGSRSSIEEILGAMSNVDSLPSVSKTDMNPDGGFTYTVTFPTSMRNVPELEVYLSDIPVSISTIEDSNVLNGFFRLEYGGQVTDPIPIDADEAQMQIALEDLSSAGEVIVSRSDGDDQNGYTWTIQFASDENGGDLDDLIVHSEDVSSTSNAGGASVQVVPGGTDGSYISGTFTVEFGKSSCLQQSILSFFQLL
jgi:hypothetical protein